MGFLKRLFGKSSNQTVEYQTRIQPARCDGCGGALNRQGVPYYHCGRCDKNYCNPCALREGRSHRTATVACLTCKSDVRTGRTWI